MRLLSSRLIMDEDYELMRSDYRKYISRKIIFIIACIVSVIILAGISCTLGGRQIEFFHVYQVIWDHISGAVYEHGSEGWWDDYIICSIRMPRIVMAVIAGASLALGGLAMQSVMSNSLAEPYTTGISSGACFGAVLALIIGFSFSATVGQYGIVTNAFLCGMIPAIIIILISRYVHTSPATLVLAGIAISYMFSAMTTLIQITAHPDDLQAAYLWQVGSLADVSWSDIPLMLTITIIGSIFLQYTSNKLNILTLGDDSAKSLGLDAAQYRMICLILISLMTASIISYTGIIGFVGLTAPHIVRMTLGSDNKYLVPASMAFGSVLMLFADLLGRTIIPGELPVGLIMSFIGGILFLYLILNQKKGYGEAY